MRKDRISDCPTCGGIKDSRAVMCRGCQMLYNHPRQGTGNHPDGHLNKSIGYIEIYVDGVKMLQHRHIMEQHLERKLLTSEHVHHINGNKIDNRIENLIVMTSSEHMRYHQLKRWGHDNI